MTVRDRGTYRMPGLEFTDRTIDVPLDHDRPGGETIEVFVREVVDPTRRGDDLPLLLYLQGGPGGKGPRPLDRGGWLDVALERFRVILLDQRGTGRSSPLDGTALARRGDDTARADHLVHFRADSIVADAEAIRQHVYGGRRWATLGQSYGGFLTLTYLSTAPEALTACYVAGGIPGLPPDAAEVYRRTFPRVRRRMTEHYRRFPDDVARIAAIADRLAVGDVALPDGDLLTVRRFQSIGIDLGMKPGSGRLRWLIDEAFAAPDRLSDVFLTEVMNRTSQRGGPLFWSLQESIYGHADLGPTGWAAQAERDRVPEFSPDARPLLLTGEMAFPWMFDEIAALRPFAGAVELLARRTHWSALYDQERLARNEVPLAAAVYHDDMFVDAGLQLDTLDRIGASTAWVTNEWEHDGIGDARVLRGLLERIDDEGGPR